MTMTMISIDTMDNTIIMMIGTVVMRNQIIIHHGAATTIRLRVGDDLDLAIRILYHDFNHKWSS
jgi:hypothetical protein